MGSCLKGKSDVKQKDAKYACEKCGAAAEKKDHICKPENVNGEKKEKKGKKEKKK